MSTQGDSPLCRFAQIDSPLDELSRNNCLTSAEIEARLMVTFVTINHTVMVDDTNNGIEYIKTNPLNMEPTLTIRVKQEAEECESLLIDLLDSSENEISGDSLTDNEEEEEGKEQRKEELLRMLEDNSELGIRPITTNAPPRNSPSHTVKLE